MKRDELLVARAWERARRKHLQTEGFLEDALASALESPEFWTRFRAAVDPCQALPTDPPEICTQSSVDEGRTDITLAWSDGLRLALELKVVEPPQATQVERYLRSGLDVLAIASRPAALSVQCPPGRRYLGLITWSRIHSLSWAEAPLAVRQLRNLIEATGCLMTSLTRTGLEGLHVSWGLRAPLEMLTRKGLDALRAVLSDAGLNWVIQEKMRQHVKVDDDYQRLVWWVWPPPWSEDGFGIYSGLYFGYPEDPTLVSGLPDLVMALHVDPKSARGRRLRSNETWVNSAIRWSRHRVDDASREFDPAPDSWEILRFRCSSASLLDVDDQGGTLISRMQSAAQEWADGALLALLQEFTAT